MKTVDMNSDGELPFKAWAALTAELAAAGNDLSQARAILAPYIDATIYHFQLTQDETGWKGARSWFAHCCLWQGEVRAYRAVLDRPKRRWGGILEHRYQVDVIPKRLAEILEAETHLNGLLSRLRHLSAYDPASLPDWPQWLWCIDGANHWNLQLEEGRVRLPASWKIDEYKCGPIQLHGNRLQVINDEGFSGLIDSEGFLRVPCRYAYLLNLGLDLDLKDGVRVEVNEQSDDWACELIDGDGNRINPEGIKVLPDTYLHGIATVRHEGAAEDGLQGYMDKDGNLLGDIRWRQVRQHWGNLAAVQCPETELWGYVNQLGDLIIEPRFTAAGTFNYGYAIAEVDDSGLSGVVDATGKMVVEMKWHEVQLFEREYFMVTDSDGRYGVLNQQGEVVIELRFIVTDKDDDPRCQMDIMKMELKSLIYQRYAEELKSTLFEAKISMAPFTGKFRRDANDRDLEFAGIWLAGVVLLQEYSCAGRIFTPGTAGKISFYYPNSADMFDMRVEVPVSGLDNNYPELTVGVPWELLRIVKMGVNTAYHRKLSPRK